MSSSAMTAWTMMLGWPSSALTAGAVKATVLSDSSALSMSMVRRFARMV